MAPSRPSARFEFPIMLYSMLEDCTFDEGLSKIVSWQPHGLSFKVHDRESMERVLPRWFQEKYESFRCLLEQWGFVKLSRGKDRGCWYQANFAHGRKAKLQNISKKEFLNGMPEYMSPREEPNLYSMTSPECSIVEKKKRLMSLRDHTNSAHEVWPDTQSIKSSSSKRSRDGDDLSAGPPPKKEKKPKSSFSSVGGGSISTSSGRNPSVTKVHPPVAKVHPVAKVPPPPPPPLVVDAPGGGCQICGQDDDHSNLLLCEGCDTEIHTYCLDPPLDSVPDDDWFCDACAQRMAKDRKELDKIIKIIPEEMRSRFGEVCFSKSGERAQWWPAMIFDPRTFLQNKEVVELCKRNLGKRNLMFYFENQDAFAAVPNAWVMTWDEGVKREFDKGKPVRSASKPRRDQYQHALEAAKIAMLASTDPEERSSGGSASTRDDSYVSQPEATPSNPLKEVTDDSVLCSKCGKTVEVSDGPVLLDGYWYCHTCHGGSSSLAAIAPTKPASATSAKVIKEGSARNAQEFMTKEQGITAKGEGNPLISADATWLSVRDDAIQKVGGGDDLEEVEIDDEILKGITQRPSGKWQAQVYYAGKSRYIGVFETRQKAALAFKLVRGQLRPQVRPKFTRKRKTKVDKNSESTNSTPEGKSQSADGAVHSSFSNLFGKKYATKKTEKRLTAFTDKKPSARNHTRGSTSSSASGGNNVSDGKSSRYLDSERTKILLDTPLCRFYSNIPICDL